MCSSLPWGRENPERNCARRSPGSPSMDGGSIPPISTISMMFTHLARHRVRPPTRGAREARPMRHDAPGGLRRPGPTCPTGCHAASVGSPAPSSTAPGDNLAPCGPVRRPVARIASLGWTHRPAADRRGRRTAPSEPARSPRSPDGISNPHVYLMATVGRHVHSCARAPAARTTATSATRAGRTVLGRVSQPGQKRPRRRASDAFPRAFAGSSSVR